MRYIIAALVLFFSLQRARTHKKRSGGEFFILPPGLLVAIQQPQFRKEGGLLYCAVSSYL